MRGKRVPDKIAIAATKIAGQNDGRAWLDTHPGISTYNMTNIADDESTEAIIVASCKQTRFHISDTDKSTEVGFILSTPSRTLD